MGKHGPPRLVGRGISGIGVADKVKIAEKLPDDGAKAIRVHLGGQEGENHFVLAAITKDSHGGYDTWWWLNRSAT